MSTDSVSGQLLDGTKYWMVPIISLMNQTAFVTSHYRLQYKLILQVITPCDESSLVHDTNQLLDSVCSTLPTTFAMSLAEMFTYELLFLAAALEKWSEKWLPPCWG